MDGSFAITGLIESVEVLIRESDYEGAESILNGGLELMPAYAAFIHYQFGKLYCDWNKLSSSLTHLEQAAELANQNGEDLFLLQVQEELKRVRYLHEKQKP